jgi:DNA-3-methyladenine glycosylase II
VGRKRLEKSLCELIRKRESMGDVYSIFASKKGRKDRYRKHLAALSQHPRFRSLIKLVGSVQPEVPIWHSIDDAVLYSVVGQMLSLSAASSIIKKLLQEFKTSSEVINWASKTSHSEGPLKGLSKRKRKALRAWKDFSQAYPGTWKKWGVLPLDEFRDQVMSIWGFGRWSSDMIGIFHLGRMDVWPESDMGIKKACKVLFKTDRYSKIRKHVAGSETVAAIYLWELLNRKLENALD